MDEGLLSISTACCGQLVKILITLEPLGLFESNFAYLFHCQATGMQKDDMGLPSINFAGRAIIVKMLITLERMVYFNLIVHTITFLIYLPIGWP